MSLIYVLWSVAILSTISLTLFSTSNISSRLTHNAFDVARVDTIANAAIHRAVLALLDPRPEKHWRVDGVPEDFIFDGTRIKVFIQDELGRIDLNHADASLLVRLFQSAGLDQEKANSLAEKILDWRDPRPVRRLNGAKEQDYRAAGRNYEPRSGPFQSVDEVKLVLDMTPDVFTRTEQALTVYSSRQFIDPQIAPYPALLALPATDEAKAKSLVAARTRAHSSPVRGNQGDNTASLLYGRAFTVRTEINGPLGNHVREAVIRLTGHPSQPYWVLNWARK